MTYDGLILVGLWMIVGAAVVLIAGDAIDSGQHWFQLMLLAAAFLYFGGCWRYGRQTVGMRAWKIELQSPSYPPPYDALLTRFLVAIASMLALGAGFWTALLRADASTWHDRASRTALVVVDQPRRSNR